MEGDARVVLSVEAHCQLGALAELTVLKVPVREGGRSWEAIGECSALLNGLLSDAIAAMPAGAPKGECKRPPSDGELSA